MNKTEYNKLVDAVVSKESKLTPFEMRTLLLECKVMNFEELRFVKQVLKRINGIKSHKSEDDNNIVLPHNNTIYGIVENAKLANEFLDDYHNTINLRSMITLTYFSNRAYEILDFRKI